MFDDIQRVHVIGAGGIGASAAAKWFLAEGKRVTGSDAAASDLTRDLERRGIPVTIGHDLEAVRGADLVLFSPAVPDTDPGRAEAAALGVRQISYPQFLGELSRAHTTVAVSGTNGKSTTTAMLGLILEAAGLDPLVIVGSLVPGFPDGNLRHGLGRFFVVEACEYRAHMLNLEPEMVVLTNVEADHLDYFRDLDHIRDTFQTFLDKLKGKGLAVLNADDPESAKLGADRAVRYGAGPAADYVAGERRVAAGHQAFSVTRPASSGGEGIDETLGDLVLRVPGAFNVANALAAASAALELGVPFDACQRVLRDFSGIWRRFERVGEWRGAEIISDYGHHPTAIRGTLEAAREFFPKRRVVLCFQPHQHARTRELFDEFVDALKGADALVLPEIYRVSGRTDENEGEISSRDLAERIRAAAPGLTVRYARDLKEARRELEELVRAGDVVIVQGAGDVDRVARELVA